jgi:hypothetical protein
MLIFGQPAVMTPATIPTMQPVVPTTEPTKDATVSTEQTMPAAALDGAASSLESASSEEEHARRSDPAHGLNPVPDELIDNLVLRVAAPDEDEAVDELARRAGAERPAGALMIATIDGRLLAAVSMKSGESVREPTPLGFAAAAVVRYRLARLGGPRGTSQKAAIAA